MNERGAAPLYIKLKLNTMLHNSNQINAFISELENPRQFDKFHGEISEGDTITFLNNDYYWPDYAGKIGVRKVAFMHPEGPVVRYFGSQRVIKYEDILATCE